MKLVVLGATGGTGLEIVLQGIEHGHEVTAFVRNPERLKTFGERVAVVRGDLLDAAELARAIEGHDAVLSAFGPRYPVAKSDADLLRRFALALTAAMRQAGVTRVAVESVAFLFKDAIIPPRLSSRPVVFPSDRRRCKRDGENHQQQRARLDHRAPAATYKPAPYWRLPRAGRAFTWFRIQNLARGCGRFHDWGNRETRVHRQSRRGMQLMRRTREVQVSWYRAEILRPPS